MSEGLPHEVRSSFPTQKIKNFLDRIEKLLELTGIYGYTVVYRNIMSCPTNESDVDFFVLRTLKIDENIRNPRIFLRKMATCSCFAGPIDIRIHASMYCMSICPLTHIIAIDKSHYLQKENEINEHVIN